MFRDCLPHTHKVRRRFGLFTIGIALNSLALGLLATSTAGRGPREVGDREDEEAVAAVGNTSKGVVPSSKGSQQTEEATGLDHGRVRVASVVALDVTNTEKQEGQVQEEEQQEEGHGGSQSAEEQDCGENEPALELSLAPTVLITPRLRAKLTIKNNPNEL